MTTGRRKALAVSLLLIIGLLFFLLLCPPLDASNGETLAGSPGNWWAWLILLFLFTLLVGIVSVLTGVGGGVLFVPMVGAFFPFHFDFVRCAGLIVALVNSLSATPRLYRHGLAHFNLTLPLALLSSIAALLGAWIGLRITEEKAMLSLGILILGVVALMIFSRPRPGLEPLEKKKTLAQQLGWIGAGPDPSTGKRTPWEAEKPLAGLGVFFLIGLTTGIFGLGAGWANVPALHLLMGVPLKTAVATSTSILGVTTPAAAFMYINSGALLPLIVAPSLLGMALGARIGVRLLTRANPDAIRKLVILLMVIAAARLILKGIQSW